jgi:hypothetical protein
MSDDFSAIDALNDNAGVVGFAVGSAVVRNQARTQAEIESLKKTIAQKFEDDAKSKEQLLDAKENLFQFKSRLDEYCAIENLSLKYLKINQLKIDWFTLNLDTRSFDNIDDKAVCEELSKRISSGITELEENGDKEQLNATKSLMEYFYLVKDIEGLIQCESTIRILKNEIYSTVVKKTSNLVSESTNSASFFNALMFALGFVFFGIMYFYVKGDSKLILLFFTLFLGGMAIIFTFLGIITPEIMRDKKLYPDSQKNTLLTKKQMIRQQLKESIDSYSSVDIETRNLFLKDDMLDQSEIQFLETLINYTNDLATALGIPMSEIQSVRIK